MSKTVVYEITKEMIDRIKPGQTFDGYKDIAQKIGVVAPGHSPVGRDTKNQFFSDISKYIDFQSIHGTNWGMKAIIVKDFDKANGVDCSAIPDPMLPIDVFQRVAAFQLMCFYKDKTTDGLNSVDAIWTPSGMLYDCCFVNSYDYSFGGTVNLQNEVGRRNIFNLKRDVKHISKDIFSGTLRSLQDIGVIEYKNVLVAIGRSVLVDGNIEYRTVKLSDDELEMYRHIENDLLSKFKNEDGVPCNNQEEIYKCNCAKSFYESLREIAWKYFKCKMILSAYSVTIHPEIVDFVNELSYYFGVKDSFLLANETFARILLNSKTSVSDQEKLKKIVDEIICLDDKAINRLKLAGVPKYVDRYGLTEDKSYAVQISSDSGK